MAVPNMLGTAIRKSNRVRSLGIASTISSLGSVEVGVGIIISYSIGVGVGRWLIWVGRGVIGRGSVDNRGSVVDRGSVVSWSMSKDSLSSMKTVRRVSNSSNSSSESLGLSGAPVFSLVRLGY